MVASKLRVHNKLMANPGDVFTGGEEMKQTETEGNLTFEQQWQLQERELMMLELCRKMQIEEWEAKREKREYQRQRAGKEEERLVREEERGVRKKSLLLERLKDKIRVLISLGL